jgi:hypothetical protein
VLAPSQAGNTDSNETEFVSRSSVCTNNRPQNLRALLSYWDFDNPDHALPYRINEAMRRGFFRENARTVYRQ